MQVHRHFDPLPHSENTYVADTEDLQELARLIAQDTIFTAATPPVFTAKQWQRFKSVLDLGCGPGGWCLTQAKHHPQASFTGVDVSQNMLHHASLLARAENTHNVDFQAMNVLSPWPFPAHTFDFVHSRMASSFLYPGAWEQVMQECFRVLRPGGKVLFWELETTFFNAVAPFSDKLMTLLTTVGLQTGRSFAASGKSTGFSVAAERLLRDAGFRHIHVAPFFLDVSSGSKYFELNKIGLSLGNTIISFLAQTGLASREDIDTWLQEAEKEQHHPAYRAMNMYVQAYGTR